MGNDKFQNRQMHASLIMEENNINLLQMYATYDLESKSLDIISNITDEKAQQEFCDMISEYLHSKETTIHSLVSGNA